MCMGYEFIRSEKVGKTALITLNAPEKRNALDVVIASELDDALSIGEADQDVKVMILTGEGKTFCAGGDVKAMAEAKDPQKFLGELSGSIHKPVFRIWNMEKVVIAAINGPAVGAGCGLAMACDLRYASKKATFNMGFMNIGLAPGVGTYFLPRLIGRTKAAELAYLGKTISAQEAKDIGLVNDVFENETFMAKVMEAARAIETGPTLAIGRAKTLLRLSEKSQLSEHLAAEQHMISISGSSQDFREGVNAFIEKRKPRFKGK
jgi:2-(1,2-epoxy-1,2-dihydrophenyl)acetyl-CoA isomerase